MRAFLQNSTVSFLLLAFVGGVIGYSIVSFCQDGGCTASLTPGAPSAFDAESNHFMLALPVYYVWLFFIIFLSAFSFLIVIPLWSSLRQFRPYLTRSRVGDLLGSSFVLLILFAVPDGLFGLVVGAGKPLPVYLFFLRILVLLVVLYLCLLPAVIGIWMVRHVIEKQYQELGDGGLIEPARIVDFLAGHMRLRELSQRYLAAVGVVVTLVTLTNGANRNIMTTLQPGGNNQPTAVILTYGLYFTVVVALVYAPTYFALLRTGHDLRDRLYPVQQVETLRDMADKRKVFEETLQLNINIEQSLQTGLILLSPLLTGIITLFLGK